jgi:hypothetical protein
VLKSRVIFEDEKKKEEDGKRGVEDFLKEL